MPTLKEALAPLIARWKERGLVEDVSQDDPTVLNVGPSTFARLAADVRALCELPSVNDLRDTSTPAERVSDAELDEIERGSLEGAIEMLAGEMMGVRDPMGDGDGWDAYLEIARPIVERARRLAAELRQIGSHLEQTGIVSREEHEPLSAYAARVIAACESAHGEEAEVAVAWEALAKARQLYTWHGGAGDTPASLAACKALAEATARVQALGLEPNA